MKKSAVHTLAGLIVASFLVVALIAQSANAAFPGENGRIALTRFAPTEDPDHPFELSIFTSGLHGEEITRLTSGLEAAEPAWSANGRRIAFVSLTGSGPGYGTDGRYGEIWTMAEDGRDKMRLTTGEHDQHPAWSPDGRWIAFTRYAEGDRYVYVMGSDGKGARRLNRGFDPAWSVNGRLAFALGSDFIPGVGPSYDIWTTRTDATNPRPLATHDLPSDKEFSEPSWAPRGDELAFSNERTACPPSCFAYFEIHLIGADGSHHRRLTAEQGGTTDPAWSPDGSRILAGALVQLVAYSITGDRVEVLHGVIGHDYDWQPIVPRPEDFKTRSAFCKAELERLGEDGFRYLYGNHGRCVSETKAH